MSKTYRYPGLVATILFISSSVVAAPIWQGPYIGAYFGAGFGNNDTTTNIGTVTDLSYFTNANNIAIVNQSGSWTKHPISLIGGIQAGHDWSWQQMVFGVIVDYGTLSLSSSNHVPNITFLDNSDQYSIYTSIKTNWLFTLRARLGYQTIIYAQPTLFYLTSGMAMTQLKVANVYTDNSSLAGAGSGYLAENQIGWALGAGIEVLAYCNMSVSLEYLYVQIPSATTEAFISNTAEGFGIPALSLTNPFNTRGKFYGNLIKITMNYRFNE